MANHVLYLYANGNSASWRDPLGLFSADDNVGAAELLYWTHKVVRGEDTIEGKLGFFFVIEQSLHAKNPSNPPSAEAGTQTWQANDIFTSTLLLNDKKGECRPVGQRDRIKDVVDFPAPSKRKKKVFPFSLRDKVRMQSLSTNEEGDKVCVFIQTGKKRLGLRTFHLTPNGVSFDQPRLDPGVGIPATDAEWEAMGNMSSPILEADFLYVFVDPSCACQCDKETRDNWGKLLKTLLGVPYPHEKVVEAEATTFEFFRYANLGQWSYPKGAIESPSKQ